MRDKQRGEEDREGIESKTAPKRAKAGEYNVYSEKENCANRY
jgi:hypothetical protein